ncbi:MAG TPA: 30S ribosomal protein S20 [Candidatus Saccharimonadia bacterium]|nr:30S ribosomal protein S20 [Candidatus Saccharimonadia bacterium]
MPIIKSAKKRVKVTKRATAKNLKVKRSLRAAVKDLRSAVSASNSKNISDSKRRVQSNLDKAAKKGIMHKNKVARKQRQLAKQARVTAKAVPKKKTTPKK